MLIERQLYLSGLTTLRADDPFEGSATIASHRLAAILRSSREAYEEFFRGLKEWPDFAKQMMIDRMEDPAGNEVGLCFVSCWHSGPHESAALWKLYSNTTDGVAIRSTVDQLARSVDSDRNFVLGAVTYHNYEAVHAKPGQLLAPVFMKRNSFEHEREIRLLYWASDEWLKPQHERAPWARGEYTLPEGPEPNSDWPAGIAVQCDPGTLINEVLVTPYAPPWVTTTIAATLAGLGFEQSVRRSSLMEGPS